MQARLFNRPDMYQNQYRPIREGDCPMVQSLAGIDDRIYPPHKIALLVGTLQEEGIAPADTLNGSGIDAPALRSPATRVSYRQLLTVMRNTQRLSGIPAIALHTARRIRLSTFGLFGYALVSSQNARDAADLYIRYQKLAAPLLHIRLREDDHIAAWVYEDFFGLESGDDLFRFIVEFTICAGVAFTQDVMGDECKPFEIRVAYPAPTYADSYRAYFDCPVHFGQPENEARYDAIWLGQRPNLANPITATMLHEMCDRMLSEMNMTSGIAAKVHGVLLQNPGNFPDEDEVAEKLFMVSRTLRRKLEAEGTSYNQILSDVRKHLAIKYLRETRMSTDDIAASLGFSEVTSFRHAFKRWTGKTPGEFRPD